MALQQENLTTSTGHAHSDGTAYICNTFTAAAAYTLETIDVYLNKDGSPGNVEVFIYTVDGSDHADTLLATFTTIASAGITGTIAKLSSTGTAALSNGVKYSIVLKWNAPNNGSNRIGNDFSDPYSTDLMYWSNDLSSFTDWGAFTLRYSLYGTAAAPPELTATTTVTDTMAGLNTTFGTYSTGAATANDDTATFFVVAPSQGRKPFYLTKVQRD